jgi:hypothetical protein
MPRGALRSYIGAPRVYLTFGIHDDGEWKRMWYVNGPEPQHFWTWREAIDYALTFVPENPRPRRFALSIHKQQEES